MSDTLSNHITSNTLKFFSKKTRDRVLASSLILFNERGFSNVTTASIAKHANVLEGSLWYHFNTKKDLLTEHVKILTDVFSIENKTVDSKDFKSIINGIFNSYEILWDFRYILRDDFQNTLQKNCDVLISVKKTNNYLDEWADERIRHSSKIGLLNIDSKNTENISEISFVVLGILDILHANKTQLAFICFLHAEGLQDMLRIWEELIRWDDYWIG